MDFVKKHYEKILLSVVLLGLVGALVFLPFMINADRTKLTEIRMSIIHQSVKPLDPLDLTRQTNVIDRLQSPYKLDFSTTNKLFNPIPWQKTPAGQLIKITTGNEVGAGAAVVTRITPLCLILTLDKVETNELGARYSISAERQAAALPAQRGKRQHYASVGEKNEVFTITDVSGSPADPAHVTLSLILKDTGERAILSADKPFRRVDGYVADLKYDIEKKTWQGQRINMVLKFGGDEYKIVAINQDSVILSATSNQKKTTLPYSP